MSKQNYHPLCFSLTHSETNNVFVRYVRRYTSPSCRCCRHAFHFSKCLTDYFTSRQVMSCLFACLFPELTLNIQLVILSEKGTPITDLWLKMYTTCIAVGCKVSVLEILLCKSFTMHWDRLKYYCNVTLIQTRFNLGLLLLV